MSQFNTAQLYQTLQQLSPELNFLVAYSGGLDSHTLLHSLATLASQNSAIKLRAIHINHGLSANANAWAEHCQQVCQGLNIPCTVVSIHIAKSSKSLEEAAREARYAAFAQTLHANENLLTAHNCNDQAETLLLQLLRGAGPKGLATMPNKMPFANAYLIRPLLTFSRQELLEYAILYQLKWIEDESNTDTRFDRNYLRQNILPILQNRWPASIQTLSRSAAHCAQAANLLDELAAQDWQNAKGSDEKTLHIPALLQLSDARQRNLIRYWLEQLNLPFPSTIKLKQLQRDVLQSRYDAMPKVTWKGVEVRRFRHQLHAMQPLNEPTSDIKLSWNLQNNLHLPNDLGILKALQIQGQGLKIENPNSVTVRFRSGGEILHPIGRQGSHPLKKLFQEWNVPTWKRKFVPLIFVNDELAAVVGYAIDQKYMTQESEFGYQLEFFSKYHQASFT